ncbi:pecanex-like protein 4 isoform X1 [Clavelina lepadiformis]|uniref:pecanex-like protein 4 isoform X1 n=1 Tax=Clavelina lepadiformis TaxID=159417 RepID=UPI004042C0E1
MPVDNVPLLNEYKQEFVAKRIPQTLLGGPNLKLGYSAPFYVYVAQIALWFVPWVISGIFTVSTEVGGLSILLGSILTGVLVGVFVLTLQIVHVVRSFKKSSNPDRRNELTSSQQFRQLLADDDEIFFTSCCSSTTYNFVIPKLRFTPGVILRALFAGVLSGLGYWYTLPSVLNALYGSSVAATVIIYIFSWVAISCAQYPLNVGGIPPEVATFHSVDPYDIASLSRATHVFVFYAFHVVQVYITSYSTVNAVLHILFLFLPLLWLSGLFPPIDSLFLWSLEQLLVFALGGSPMATDARLLTNVILSGSVLIAVSFISSIPALVLFSACFGFLLSTDVVSVVFVLLFKFLSFCSSKFNESDVPHYGGSFSLVAVGWHIVTLAITALVAALGVNYQTQIASNSQIKIAFEILFIILAVLCKLLQDFQRVYVCFRLFRNCFYPNGFANTTGFAKRKKILDGFGYLHLSLTSMLAPLLMVFYLSSHLHDSGTVILPSFVNGLITIHAFRMVWQRSNSGLLIFAVFSTIELILTSPTVALGWYETISPGGRLLLLDICIDRSFRLLDNMWFAFVTTITSYTDKKQRRKSSAGLVALNILFLPLVIAVIVVATAISAPIFPIFTLPLFYVAFPRPSRFWPQTPGEAPASVCSDTAYYLQMAPNLCRALSRGTYLGTYSSLGAQGSDLSSFLARSQDKTFWVQTLEQGYGYASFYVKGLELQETSCHALEATRVDDACEAAFEKPGQASCLRTNPYPFLYSLTPLDTISIDGYSDAKNSLSGIIDYPIAVKQFHSDYVKCVVWLLAHFLRKKRQRETIDIPVIPSGPFERKKAVIITQPSSRGPEAIKKEPVDVRAKSELSFESLEDVLSSQENGVKLNSLKPSRRSARPAPSPSLGSIASILTNNEETAFVSSKAAKERKSRSSAKSTNLPGTVPDSDDDLWDLDSELSDSGFGLSSADARKKTTNDVGGKLPQSNGHLNFSTGWGEIPVSDRDLEPYKQLFDKSWYLHVTSSIDDKSGAGWEEDELMMTCRKLTLASYYIIFVQSVPGRDPDLVGASHLCKVYLDNIPWSPGLDWLRQRPDLHQLVVEAHRYAIKMMYDRVVMGTVESAGEEAYDEMVTSLQEYDSDWFIGVEGSRGWEVAVSKGVSSLFSLSYDSNKGEYSSRMLLRRKVETHVTRLSSAAVRGIWSNLSWELLYATNDDEERYSIQAQKDLLRNLTTQAADPPLGYPIYSSPPIYESTLPLPRPSFLEFFQKK